MKTRKIRCGAVLFCFLLLFAILPSGAAEPTVSTDEAVYVTLDHYGKTREATVVKGCSMNGNTDFVDFGNYEKVVNMSNYDEPELGSDGVHWKLSSPVSHFYYECTPKKDSLVLPWDFDISYKLNGVPTRAEKLLGANGLIEINIECIPNENAAEYYRHNLLLQAATLVDTQDVLSIDAPGAQTQSLGTYKAILFAALPGEHTTFTIRIGSEDFSFSGVVMMMIPGTLEQMKNIKDIKEAKETVNDSADAIYDSMNQILGVLNSMSSGLSETKSGLSSLDRARESVNGTKDSLYADTDEALEALGTLSEHLLALLPDLERGSEFLTISNQEINQTVSDLLDLKPILTDVKTASDSLKKDLSAFQTALKDINATKEDRKKLADDLEFDLQNMQTDLDLLHTRTASLSRGLTRMEDSTSDLSEVLEKIPETEGANPADMQALVMALTQLFGGGVNISGLFTAAQTQITQLAGYCKTLISHSAEVVHDLAYLSQAAGSVVSALSGLMNSMQLLTDTLNQAVSLSNSYLDIADRNSASAEDALGQSAELIGLLGNTSAVLNTVCDDLNTANSTVNQYHSAAKDGLGQLIKITSALSNGSTSLRSFLATLENLLRNNSENLNGGTKSTLNGLISVLEKGLESISVTNTVRNANDSIKRSADKELDKITEDTQLLELDAELDAVSFTSPENPPPATIQVVLRSEEITKDAISEMYDLEPPEENLGFWGRLAQVFVRIWNGICSIFR